MTNGYIVLTKGDAKLYQHAVEAINLGKPIYYADGNKVAFVNSIELDSTNVIIKTSDKQITVASNGSTTDDKLVKNYLITINGEYSDKKQYNLDFKKESSSLNTTPTKNELITILKSLYYNVVIDSNGNGVVMIYDASLEDNDDIIVSIMISNGSEESATNPTITISEI